MNFDDFRSFAETFGPTFAIGVAIFWVLAKNGFLKVILRDSTTDEIVRLGDRLTLVERDIAVLRDRWDRME